MLSTPSLRMCQSPALSALSPWWLVAGASHQLACPHRHPQLPLQRRAPICRCHACCCAISPSYRAIRFANSPPPFETLKSPAASPSSSPASSPSSSPSRTSPRLRIARDRTKPISATTSAACLPQAAALRTLKAQAQVQVQVASRAALHQTIQSRPPAAHHTRRCEHCSASLRLASPSQARVGRSPSAPAQASATGQSRAPACSSQASGLETLRASAPSNVECVRTSPCNRLPACCTKCHHHQLPRN